MSDAIYRGMSRAARWAAAFKAGDEPGQHAVLDEVKARDDSPLRYFALALGARLVQVTEELCGLTGQDCQTVLDGFACDAIGVENGGSVDDPA